MSDRRPNLVVFLCDQMRGMAMSHRGDPNVRTLNLDNLAAQGMSFPNAVAGAPWCCPFRAAMLTGRYPHQVGVTKTPGRLDPSHKTFAHALNDAGYHTAWFGKWHLDGWRESDGRSAFHEVPKERRGGFQHWVGYENNNSPFDCYVHGDGIDGFEPVGGYATGSLTVRALGHLRRHVKASPNQPFAVVISVQPPHDPYLRPDHTFGSHGRLTPSGIVFRPNVPPVDAVRDQAAVDLAGYYAAIEGIDIRVGQLIEELRHAEVLDHTHLLFLSDHGDSHGSHGLFRKSNPYEESIRIPFILGGGVPFYRDRVGSCDAPLNHLDIAPTLLGLCGVEAPPEMAGHDFSGHRTGTPKPNEPDAAYLQQAEPKKWPNGIDTAWRGVVTRDGWKYVRTPGDRWLLFDLNTDPYEMNNLVFDSRFADKRRALHERLRRFVVETGDEFPMPDAA